jgi:hypothetical protein
MFSKAETRARCRLSKAVHHEFDHAHDRLHYACTHLHGRHIRPTTPIGPIATKYVPEVAGLLYHQINRLQIRIIDSLTTSCIDLERGMSSVAGFWNHWSVHMRVISL